MLKRFAALFLSFILICASCAFADGFEEELDIEEIIDLSEEESSVIQQDSNGNPIITITCTGDLTIGGDNFHRKGKKFYTELEKNNDNISFTMANVRDIFKNDNLTLVNFEGTFTNSKKVPTNKQGNDFIFNIDPKYVSVLTENSIEAVSLANNHVMDHGTEGYEETKDTLREAGVVYSNPEEIGVYHVNGIEIAMLSYLCIDLYDKPVGPYNNLYEKVAADIASTKEKYPIVIVSFHWGIEKYYRPTDNQLKMGRLAVDSGADLVIGHHSHRINPIEQYKGVYIC